MRIVVPIGSNLADVTRGGAQNVNRVVPRVDGFDLNDTDKSTTEAPPVKAHWLHDAGVMLSTVSDLFVLTTDTDAAATLPNDTASKSVGLPAGTRKLVKVTLRGELPELGATHAGTHDALMLSS
jgi:hypothetical protein